MSSFAFDGGFCFFYTSANCTVFTMYAPCTLYIFYESMLVITEHLFLFIICTFQFKRVNFAFYS